MQTTAQYELLPKLCTISFVDVLQAQLGQLWSGSDKSRLIYMYDTCASRKGVLSYP